MAVKIMITITAIIAISVVGVSVDVVSGGEEVVVWVFWGVCDGLAEVVGVREGDAEVLIWGVGLFEGLIVGEEDGVSSEVGLNANALDSAVKL
jgi:hypothetical protein